jgi:hypothetical protein
MTARIERRTQTRKRPVSLVYVELPPANGGMMRDLSEHGFAVRAMLPLQQSEKVAFSFILEPGARIDGDAIVVRLQDTGHLAALEFAGLSAHARDQIRRWLDQSDRPLGKKSQAAQAPAEENSSFEELRDEIRATERRPLPPAVQLPVSNPAPAPPTPKLSEPEELPPLLKLSSIRPNSKKKELAEQVGPAPTEAALAPLVPAVAVPEPEPEPEPEFRREMPLAEPVVHPSQEPLRDLQADLPPALEPLSSLEGENEQAMPGWMDRFTLSRAIGIMLVLTLVAGSFVYHRELGRALIWLGQKIAGDDISGSVQPSRSAALAAAGPPAIAESGQTAAGTNPPRPPASATAPSAADSNANVTQSTELPAASEATPVPQLKDATSASLVPLTQVTRAPPASAPAESSNAADQPEYQRALAILHARNREAEVPEAVRLLWAAVEKGNLAAEVTLADLYRTGRGVSKNCAQAKVLLSTAARRGSADAQKHLDELQREGCEE